MANERPARVAIYSPDGSGLGHLRRNTIIGRRILREAPGSTVLLLANSAVAPFFRLPSGMDHLKLPSIEKVDTGRYEPSHLRVPCSDLRRMSANLLRQALLDYEPDLLLVDHAPTGTMGELQPALEALKRAKPRCRIVLGLRDILDAPHVTSMTWTRLGAYEALREYYDAALIYGTPDVFDTAEQYSLPQLPCGVHYCGYVVNREPPPPSRLRAWVPEDRACVFVSVGGGLDGDSITHTYLDAVRLLGDRAGFATLMAVGPNAPPATYYRLREEAQGLPVYIKTAVEDSMATMSAADLAVCMAGYNTVAEVLYLRKKALAVPRSGPSVEQRVRAETLAERGLIDTIGPEHLSAQLLAERLLLDLRRDDFPAQAEQLDMHGDLQAATRLLDLTRRHAHAAA